MTNIIARHHQAMILRNPSRKIVVVAHRRFGKTTCALLKIILSLQPKSRFFYVAPTYRQAKLIAWIALTDLMRGNPLLDKMNEAELVVKMKDGSLIELKGSDNPDSLRGVGLDGLVLDEWSQQDPSIYTEILRPALTDKQGWSLFIGTPKGKNHFYDLFNMTDENARYFFKASDTNIIPKEELQLAEREMSEDEYRQEFDCEFLYFAGAVYREFSLKDHVVIPFDLPREWPVYLSIDHGQTNPTAILFFTVDYDGNIFAFDEHYEAGKTVSYHAQALKDKLYGYGRSISQVKSIFIDPSCKAKNRERDGQPWSVVDEYIDYGIAPIPANNEVLAGINRVKEYLNRHQLKIFNRCHNLIREIESYRWKEKKAEEANLPEEPVKLNDHAVDALRYFIMSRPMLPKKKEPLSIYSTREKYLQSRKYKSDSWLED